MNKKFLVLLLSVFILSNCASSAKIIDSFKEETKLEETLKSKVLVVAKTKDAKVRKTYEDRFKNEFSNLNITAIQSYIAFPDLRDKKNRTEEENKQIVKMFRDNNIGAVFLMSLKETKTLTKEENPTKPIANTTNYGKYKFTFTEMYNLNSNAYLSSLLEPNVNDDYKNGIASKTTLTSKIYILEGAFFNLNANNTGELVAKYTVSISEPETAKEVIDNYTKLILKELK